VTLWEMFARGETPYSEIEEDEMFDVLTKRVRLPRPPACPSQMYNIMQLCWSTDPHKRPSFGQLKLHCNMAASFDPL